MRHIGKDLGPATPVHLSDWRHNHEGFTPYSSRPPVRTTKPSLINRAETESAFFKKYGLNRTKDVQTYGINVDSIVKTNPPQEHRANSFVPREMTPDTQNKIDAIVKSIQVMTENRHKPFFDAAVQLRSLGLSLPEVEHWCYVIAGKEQKMINKVPGIMQSLRHYQQK